jgi:hypothetical protein
LKKLGFFVYLLFDYFAADIAGTNNEGVNAAETASQENENKQAEDLNLSNIIYDQWAGSGHAKAEGADNPAEAPGMRAEGGCFFCHNGYAFENNAKNLEGIGLLKGTTCDTCHIGYGHQTMTGKSRNSIGRLRWKRGQCMSCITAGSRNLI